ncbi:hypothetical protein A3A41_01875 [Candidatus Kaiserbacteria bacterium RIFCSPLOWO2_01_FULL_54_22]|nr:MAG: hypothetical protein A3A41_01875 [Candidatus Kaiserbacteria bacterium RIFCSPLOWO2_01_FULL_54_22]
MRITTRVCCCILIFSPLFVVASALRPPMTPSKCPPGSSTEVTGPKSILLTEKTRPEDAKRFLQTSIHCPNACYDARVTMTLTFTGLRVEVVATHQCTHRDKAPDDPSQNPKRGCGPGQQTPRITVSTKDVYSNVLGFRVNDQTITKSRCEGEALDASVNKFFSGLSQVTTNAKSAEAQMQAALNDLQKQSAPQPTAPPAASAGTIALSKVINGQFDISEKQKAEQVLIQAGVPAADARDAVQRIASGDADAGKRIIQEELNLNPATMQQISSITSAPSAQPVDIAVPQGSQTRQENTGFDVPQQTNARQAVPADAGQMRIYNMPAAQAEQYVGTTFYTRELSHFNDAMCANGPCDNSTPGIAHRNWPLGSVVEVCNQQNGVCANAVVMDRGPNERLTARTIDANPALRSALQMQGGLTPATYTLLSVPGGSQVAQGVGSGVTPSGTDTRISGSSPFTSITSNQTGRYTGQTSPFANVTPAPSNYFASAPRTTSAPAPYPVTSVAPIQISAQPQPLTVFQPSAPVEQSSVAQQLLQALNGGQPAPTTQGPPQTTRAVAAILAQPRSVTRGNPVALSWSSVGMKTSSPCIVRMGPAILAQKNQGSKIIPVGLGAQSPIVFTLTCTTPVGETIEKATSVAVH